MSDAEKQESQLIQEAIRLLNEEYEEGMDFNESFDGIEPV